MRQLAAPNRHFMLVARNRDRLTAVAQDLLTRGALAVDTWVMDLDDTTAHPETQVGRIVGLPEVEPPSLEVLERALVALKALPSVAE